MDDQRLLRRIHRRQPRHRRVEREDRVELDRRGVALRLRQRPAQRRIMRIADRHHRVHAVHRPAQDDEDEARVAGAGRGEGEARGQRDDAGQGGAAEQRAAGEDHNLLRRWCHPREAGTMTSFEIRAA